MGKHVEKYPEPKNNNFKRIVPSNIAGGKRAKLGDFPHMALLGYETFTNSRGKKIKSYDGEIAQMLFLAIYLQVVINFYLEILDVTSGRQTVEVVVH